MFYVYIVFSEKIDGYYCGQTQNLNNRLVEHNSGETKSTVKGIPWKLVGFLVFKTRAEAMKKEKQIKNRGVKRWLSYNENELITSI
jgi:putative endonuclease